MALAVLTVYSFLLARGLWTPKCNMINCSSMKMEFLALKWAMAEKFREYLLGHKCIVYTDNNP